MKKPEVVEGYGSVTILRNQHGEVIYQLRPAFPSFGHAVDEILQDDHIEEIMYNGSDRPIAIFHHTYGMCNTNLVFDTHAARTYVEEVAEINSKQIDEEHPILDGSLSDGSRVNCVIPPASMHVSITIRKFKHSAVSVLDLIRDGSLTSEATAFLWTSISRLGFPANLLFVGGAASGKTTMLNAFSAFIEQRERVVAIEDTPELRLRQLNTVRMVASEEKSIDMDQLLKSALRMRPDRIIVGEVRGKEAQTLFSAMNTGHDGCFGTLHANSARESVSRVTNPPMSVPMNMLSALDIIVVLKKMADGTRRVFEIAELAGADKENVRFNTVFEWDAKQKQCVSTGVPSRLKARIAGEAGMEVAELDKIVSKRQETLDSLVKKSASEQELLALVNQPS
jgi:flagellar protein FlaI